MNTIKRSSTILLNFVLLMSFILTLAAKISASCPWAFGALQNSSAQVRGSIELAEANALLKAYAAHFVEQQPREFRRAWKDQVDQVKLSESGLYALTGVDGRVVIEYLPDSKILHCLSSIHSFRGVVRPWIFRALQEAAARGVSTNGAESMLTMPRRFRLLQDRGISGRPWSWQRIRRPSRMSGIGQRRRGNRRSGLWTASLSEYRYSPLCSSRAAPRMPQATFSSRHRSRFSGPMGLRWLAYRLSLSGAACLRQPDISRCRRRAWRSLSTKKNLPEAIASEARSVIEAHSTVWSFLCHSSLSPTVPDPVKATADPDDV